MTKTVREMIEVMEAYERGEEVEMRYESGWDSQPYPAWNWETYDYRIAPSMPDTINWDHVAPEYKWMARDRDGRAYLYDKRPTTEEGYWYAASAVECIQASVFTSYKRGTVSWDNSLVERPSK